MGGTSIKPDGTESPQPPVSSQESVLVEKEPAQLIANASGLIIGLLALCGVLLTQQDQELLKGAVALFTPVLINYLQGRAIRASVYSPASARELKS